MPDADDAARDERAERTGVPAAEPLVRKTVEAWEAEKDVPGWLRAAARALHRWPRGRELLEEEFEAGVKTAADLALR
jgi:hypothetical protein